MLGDREADVLLKIIDDKLSAADAVNKWFSRIYATLTGRIHGHLGPTQSRLLCPLQC